MRKYRIRENSIADIGRYAIVGLLFGAIMGMIINSAYPL